MVHIRYLMKPIQLFAYEFEDATVEYTAYSECSLIARFKDGSVRTYGDPTAPGAEWKKLWHCVDAIRSGEPVACGIEAASAHTLLYQRGAGIHGYYHYPT